MGKVLSVISRPIKNYNIESRAHKVISKDKPVAAPTFQVNIKEAERILKENPDSLNNLLKKDTNLDINLKDIYVKSYDPSPTVLNKIEESENRPLPINRQQIVQSEFGYTEPKIVSSGRCTLRQVVKILSNHKMNLATWDAKKEASNYNLSEKTLKNIVHYFRVYHIYIPNENTKVVFGAPKLPEKDKLESGSKSDV